MFLKRDTGNDTENFKVIVTHMPEMDTRRTQENQCISGNNYVVFE